MNLNQIEYFLTVAETLNFTTAAKILYVSQPALSKQIALLEEELGGKLFSRSGRKVVLTPVGRQLQEDLLAVKEQLQMAQQRATEAFLISKHKLQISCFCWHLQREPV